MRQIFVYGMGISLLSSAVWAGPMDRSQVANDAEWVVHIDMERIIGSPIGQLLHDHLMAEMREHEGGKHEIRLHAHAGPQSDGDDETVEIDIQIGDDVDEDGWDGESNDLQEMIEQFGFNPFEDLKSFTMYGMGNDESDTVMLLHTTSAVESAVDALKEHDPSLTVSANDGHRLVTWNPDGGPIEHGGFALVRPLTQNPNDRLVIVTDSLERMTHASSVTQNDLPSLANGGGRLAAAPQSDSLFFFEASSLASLDMSGQDSDPRSLMLDRAKGVSLDIAQQDGNMSISAVVGFGDETEAQDMLSMLQGLLAMARFGLKGEPEAEQFIPLLNSIRLERDGLSLRARALVPVDTIEELAEQLDH